MNQDNSLGRSLDRFEQTSRSAGESIARFAARSPLLFSYLTVLTLQLVILAVFRPSYDTIDDIFLTMIAAGKGICPAPDAHLVFTNVLIGDVLKWLYTHAPSIPWYGFYLLVIHCAAQTAILFTALTICRSDTSRSSTGFRLALYLLTFGLAEFQFLTRIQFTTTAFVASQAGVFLLLLAWRRRVQRFDAPVVGPLSAAVCLLVVGGMIRIESLAMAAMVAVPVVLFFIKDFRRAALVPCGIAAAVAAILVAGAVVYDHRAYEQDPAWSGYRSLNQLRGKFHDNSWTYYAPETAPIFTRAGWSENDHAMIARWFSDDPELYGRERLSDILAAYPWQKNRDYSFLSWDAFGDIARNRSVLATVFALPFVLLIVPGGRRARLAILASAAVALLLVVAVMWLKKVPPERVYLPLLSFPLSVALLSFAWTGRAAAIDGSQRTWAESIRSWWIWSAWRRLPTRFEVAVTLLCVAAFMSTYRQCRQTVRGERGRVALKKFLRDVHSDGARLEVMWEAALPMNYLSPLDNLNLWNNMPMISVAWPQRTPWQEEIKRQHGIQNLAQAMSERNDIVLIATPEHRSLFKTFAKEHFGADVEFVTSQQGSDQLAAGRFKSTATATAGNTAAKQLDAAKR